MMSLLVALLILLAISYIVDGHVRSLLILLAFLLTAVLIARHEGWL